ncbi:hypothetical protein RRF57_000711 [Xylaria bambusicola]|uniref:Uncharacterized protein n=1 Tax=Xylaria bambusicola TaxID=326684 RepID=A0AAN7YUE3_9PEZI
MAALTACDYRKWQKHLPNHLTGLDFFGKAQKAREVVQDSMLQYCSALPPDVSKIVSERQRILREGGMNPEDAARQETMFTVGVFGNIAPTLFWSIYELFSDLVCLRS